MGAEAQGAQFLEKPQINFTPRIALPVVFPYKIHSAVGGDNVGEQAGLGHCDPGVAALPGAAFIGAAVIIDIIFTEHAVSVIHPRQVEIGIVTRSREAGGRFARGLRYYWRVGVLPGAAGGGAEVKIDFAGCISILEPEHIQVVQGADN